MTTNILLLANIFILVFGIYFIIYKNKVTKDKFIQTLIDNVNLENINASSDKVLNVLTAAGRDLRRYYGALERL